MIAKLKRMNLKIFMVPLIMTNLKMCK